MGRNTNHNKSKSKLKLGRRIGVWFISLIGFAFIAGIIFPASENPDYIAPDWYMAITYYVPILIAIFYDFRTWNIDHSRFQKHLSKCLKVSPEDFTPPRTKKNQISVAEELLANIEVCISLANKETHVSSFIDWYDEVLSDSQKLMKLDKVSFKGSPAYDYYRMKDEFQLHLCDAIVRAKEATISEINGRFKNSREFQRKALENFELDLNRIRPRFSPDTAELADRSVKEIKALLGLGPLEIPDDSKYQQFTRYGGTDAALLSVDLMEGHEFEHWCADLLRKNGFINVTVTPGSGDQGVDVLAEKGGVRYAIQCKCYSKDLGNTPVQEVAAGKSLPSYHCQVGAVMTNRHFTKGAQELAQANGILLWDRDHLRTMIESANN